MLKNIKLIYKILGGFMAVAALLVLVMATGMVGLKSTTDKIDRVVRTAPLIDAAMEMKYFIARDMQMVMEILSAASEAELAEAWGEHETFVKGFDTFADALLNGAETEEGTLYAAESREIRQIAEKAHRFHKTEFRPRIQGIRDLMKAIFDAREKQVQAMTRFEQSRDAVLAASEAFEGQVKDRIAARITAGATATALFAKENTWTDMAMEIKSSLLMCATAVEEYAQAVEAGASVEIKAEYGKSIAETDGWFQALLNGAENQEGRIAQVDVPALRNEVVAMQRVFAEEFQTSAGEFFDIQDKVVQLSGSTGELDTAADATGQQMIDMIGGIEDAARNEISHAQAEAGRIAAKSRNILWIVGFIAILAAVCISLWMTRNITGPIYQNIEFARKIADGDLTATAAADRSDELGDLAGVLNNMAAGLKKMVTDISGGVNTVSSSSTELSAVSRQMSDNVGQTASQAETVAAGAEELSVNTSSVAAAMEQAATNVGMVTSAVDQMAATIDEIAQNTEKARAITAGAVSKSEEASGRVGELGRAADAIGKVVETITEISEQVNLLALNATIEAARAGEAGKGFAVVANEIKELARQTAEATGEIKTRIEGIQTSTDGTVKGIGGISDVVGEINEIVATIATAVEEQSVTTREIAENVTQAAAGIGEVNENVAQSSAAAGEIAAEIAKVSQGSAEMNRSSGQVSESAGDLSKLAEELNGIVGRFKV